MLASVIASSRRRFVGLLDLHPGAAAAYSLRALSASFVNQPIIRVRRSSDNTEADFTAAQITDGTLTTWTGANDGFVRTWYDQSGNARHAEQETAGNQPQIVAGGALVIFQGRNAVYFEDTSTAVVTGYLDAPAWFNVADSSISVYAVYAQQTFENFPFLLRFLQGSTARIGVFHTSGNEIRASAPRVAGSTSVGGGAFPFNQTKILTYYANRTANLGLYLDGLSVGISADLDSDFLPFDTVRIGNTNVTNNTQRFYISEMIAFPDDRVAGVEANIAEAWGITLP